MIKMSDLKEMRPITKYTNAPNLSLDVLQEVLENCAIKKGIPVVFNKDIVKSGHEKEECLVLYHPEHEKEYEKICIRIKKQGTYAFVSVNSFGVSKSIIKDRMIKGGLNGMMSSNLLGFAVGTVAGKKIMGMSNQSKVEAEEMYYECLRDLIDEVIS